jgi:molybdopterin-guanine dinucleotide biosynthesis protein A
LSTGGAAHDVLVVLAGGRSLRFGSDKALADLGDGEPLALRTLRRLASLAPRALLVRAAPLAGLPPCARQIADPAPGTGPLQALAAAFAADLHESAFAAESATRFFVAPCDAPELSADVYPPLAEAAGRDGVACARHGERLEPLVAVWTAAAALRLAREPRPSGVEAVHHALERLGAAIVEFDADDPRFRNVNTLDEWARTKDAWARLKRAAPATTLTTGTMGSDA